MTIVRVALTVCLLNVGLMAVPSQAAEPARPNIVVILADDLGYSDLGCYGSEIDTPHLDRLAAEGLRFTQFYNTAKCHSSRVSLLSGRWCRQAGDESLRRAVTIPEVLSSAGYFTAMTGKWHLDQQPTDFGFQRYFGHLSGACNYYKGDNTFRLNGEPWEVPGEGFYTTVVNVDYALKFLNEAREAAQPWFLYVAFNAPHAPLQPLEADYRKYLGRYDGGWDATRAARVTKQRQLNLFGADVESSPRPDHIPAWKDLTPEIRDWEARRMAAYAGLIDRVDQEVGRLVADLEGHGELDNTLLLFVSDNGACPYDRRSNSMDSQPYEPNVTWSDSTGWAWMRNTPFRYYKQNQFEGGIATPAIVHWPAGISLPPGTIVHTPAHLVDVLPTVADVAAAPIPDEWPGREPTPLAGVSLVPILKGQPVSQRPPIHLLFASDRGLRDGDWKLVSFKSQPWELYNLREDRTELHDLASQHPNIVERMSGQWHDMATNVLMVRGGEQVPVAEKATGHRHPEWSVYTGENGADTSRQKAAGRDSRAKPARKVGNPVALRARRDTVLSLQGSEIVLSCQAGDPGVAMDQLGGIAQAGPYTLVFSVRSQSSGGGEVYFTTDASTKLPGGQHVAFDVDHDGAWHDVALTLDTTDRLHALRLDPCEGTGTVRLKGLRLQDASGKTLQSWP